MPHLAKDKQAHVQSSGEQEENQTSSILKENVITKYRLQ